MILCLEKEIAPYCFQKTFDIVPFFSWPDKFYWQLLEWRKILIQGLSVYISYVKPKSRVEKQLHIYRKKVKKKQK